MQGELAEVASDGPRQLDSPRGARPVLAGEEEKGEVLQKFNEYEIAKFDTLAVMENSTQNKTRRIKLEEEQGVVKKWLALHVLHVSSRLCLVVLSLAR